MNSKIALLSFCTLMTFLTGTIIRHFTVPENSKIASYPDSGEYAEKEKVEFAGAYNYISQARVNMLTNTISTKDVMKAFQQADMMNASFRKKNSPALYWEELGPDNIGGRTYALLFDKNNPQRIYAGGVSGGLWISNNGGSSWNKYDDHMPNLAVSTITQGPRGDIYFGTGEICFSGSSPNIGFWVNGGGGSIAGQGIWKSTDGGNTFARLTSTWENANPTERVAFSVVYKLAADPNNPNRIYAATQSGLRMSNDGGQTWINPLCTTASCLVKVTSDVTDVEVTNSGQVLAVANNGSYVYRSPNGNDSSFIRVFGGLPSNAGRIDIAVSPSNTAYAYAAACDQNQKYLGVYQSRDTGNTWTPVPAPATDPYATQPPYYQGWYDNTIIVDPSNPERFFLGGVTLWNYTNTAGWTRIGNNVHSDQHSFAFHPTNPNILLNGNDGGLYITNNASQKSPTFTTLNRGYNVTQFYGIAAAPSGEVMGGTQDNNTLYIDYKGATLQAAKKILGGDGGYCDFSITNPNAFFAAYQFGEIRRSSNKGISFTRFTDTHVAPSGTPAGSFVTPFRLWEKVSSTGAWLDDSYFLCLTRSVWITKGALDFSKTPKWFEIASLPIDARCLTATDDGTTLFVGTITAGGAGKLYRISGLDYVNNSLDTSGTNFDLTTGTPVKSQEIGSFNGQVVTSIAVDPGDANNIVVTLGNYGNTTYVLRSTNALSTTPSFTSIQNNLPQMPVYSALIDRDNNSKVILGTELGIYVSEDNGTSWSEQNDGLARTSVFMLRQQKLTSTGKHALYAGTYGRGIFRSTSFTGVDKIAPLVLGTNVYPNPLRENGIIQYSLNKPSDVVLTIYSMQGKEIKTIDIHGQKAGVHQLALSGNEISAGAYFASVCASGSNETVKFVVVK
jgi:photosystem II stability/assembly factor-like uncharacterized protein